MAVKKTTVQNGTETKEKIAAEAGTEQEKVKTAAKPKTTSKTAAKPKAAPPKPAAPKATVKAEAYAEPVAKNKLLFVTSECQPFAATGGLGDVMGSLPQQLAEKGMDVTVIMPLYGAVNEHYRDKMKFVTNFNVALSWRNQYCGIYQLDRNGVTYYFIDNEYYFKRDDLYGYFDDGERFAFFCKAVIDSLLVLRFFPDIIHMNDWQTGLVSVYLKTLYNDRFEFKNTRLVYTIHNIEYQGKYGEEIMEEVFGIPQWAKSLMDYNGCVNIMKAAMVCADVITTVSPTYAKEILSQDFAQGLHYITNSNKNKLRGILNGIDYHSYNPAADKALFANYSAQDSAMKSLNKTALQKMLNIGVDEEIPMIGIVTRLVAHKGLDLIRADIEEILKERVQVVLLGKGDIMYERFFTDLEHRYANKFKALIAYNQDLSRKIYAASDIFLMPSRTEPCGLSQMIASRYGAVPIVRETGGLYDSIRDFGAEGGGNGYTFARYDAGDMFFVIKKALDDYTQRPDEWKDKVRTVMEKDFSWSKSAEEYRKMYAAIK